MPAPSQEHKVIDVDDIFCVGVRDCIRIGRPPSPRPKKRLRDPVTISLVDSDDDPPGILETHSQSSQGTPLQTDHPTKLQHYTQSEVKVRAMFHAARPTKRRATDALKTAMNRVENHNRLKHEECERVSEVIEISSDSEPETWSSKKQKMDGQVRPPHDTDGEYGDTDDIPKLEAEFFRADIHSPSVSDQGHFDNDDDDCIDSLASLDISNEGNWAPLPERNKAEDLTPIHKSSIETFKRLPLPPFHLPRRKPPVDYRRVPLDWDSVGLWGTISRNYGITRFPKPFYQARRQEYLSPHRPPSLYYERGYTKLELTAKYPHLTSGSINKIIQAQGTVVLCAVVEGGLEDSDDDNDWPPPPPENKPGSLVVYRRGQVYMTPAHCHLRESPRGPEMKYYSIYDVAFNPRNSRQFLSSGYDFIVQTWEILDPDDNDKCNGLNAIRHFALDSRPQDLMYAPDGSALAISCHDGTVQLYSQDLFDDMIDAHSPFKTFCVAPRRSGHATGSTLWGKEASEHLLFTSSEPTEKGDHSGFHRAFDTYKGAQAIEFDATEAGDAAALSPDGTTFVLFTWAKDNTHPVRLYDVRRKVKEAYETGELEKFQARSLRGLSRGPCDSEEVNQASFSPDGRLLAVARNDNALHVYDTRVLSRGPLCRFEHHDSDAVDGGGFGIVATSWIQGRDRIGIISGGNDGCVRLWEPALGSTSDIQGMVIGRTDFDVAHFSVGDWQSGELPLIIGDSGGGMHTYDFANEDGIRI